MTFQRGPAPAGNLRAEKPPFGLFAADQFHLTLFRLFSQPPLRRLGAAAMFASQLPYTARIFSRPFLLLLPFLSGRCSLPPRPCSQASFPIRRGFSPARFFCFCLFFPDVAACRRGHVRKLDSQNCVDSLPPSFSNFIPCGSFCRSSFHAANHLSGPGLCVFCSWYTFSTSVFAQFHSTRSAFVSLPRETGCRNCISAWKMGLFLLVSGDEARLLSQLLFSFFFKPGDQRLCDFPSRSFLYCAGPFPLFPQNSAVALFLFLTYGPRRGKIPIAAVCLPAFPTRLCRQPYLCFSLMAPRRGEAA